MKNKIKEIIDRLGITPYRFAKDTGISTDTVYALKNDPNRYLSEDTFDRILKTYDGLTPNDVIGASDEKDLCHVRKV